MKDEKVNFYRENLFISSLGEGITFNIYETEGPKTHRLIKSLHIEGHLLSSVEKRAAMFHTESEGYELVWECC